MVTKITIRIIGALDFVTITNKATFASGGTITITDCDRMTINLYLN